VLSQKKPVSTVLVLLLMLCILSVSAMAETKSNKEDAIGVYLISICRRRRLNQSIKPDVLPINT